MPGQGMKVFGTLRTMVGMTGIHPDECARSVGTFEFTGPKAPLPEQGCLLVAQNAGYRNFRACKVWTAFAERSPRGSQFRKVG